MAVNLKLLVAEIAGSLGIIALALFLSAGTLQWVGGWVFVALLAAFTLALSGWLLRHDPGLLAERMAWTSQPGQKRWDRVFTAAIQVSFVGWLVLMPLDAVRFEWSRVPVGVQVGGAALLVGSFVLLFATFRANPYLSPVVRDQAERGQTVISTGPYRVVRHPMYAGALAFFAGTPLLLGSWSGLLLGTLMSVGVAVRAVWEERELRAELNGYDAYAARVRYRLIPFVW